MTNKEREDLLQKIQINQGSGTFIGRDQNISYTVYLDKFDLSGVVQSLNFGNRLSNTNDTFIFDFDDNIKHEVEAKKQYYYDKSYICIVYILPIVLVLSIFWLPLFFIFWILPALWYASSYVFIKNVLDSIKAVGCRINIYSGKIEFNSGLIANISDLASNSIVYTTTIYDYSFEKNNIEVVNLNLIPHQGLFKSRFTNFVDKEDLKKLQLFILQLHIKMNNTSI